MAPQPTVATLLDIERRQDDVLRDLEELDSQVELALAAYQRGLKIVSPTTVRPETSSATRGGPSARSC